jgi:hypothetical protein
VGRARCIFRLEAHRGLGARARLQQQPNLADRHLISTTSSATVLHCDTTHMDPFGSRSHLTTSALSKQHTITDDIYERLFDRIFSHSKEFTYWSQGNRPWQLHCYGAPGCGKVRYMLSSQKVSKLSYISDHTCCHCSSKATSKQLPEQGSTSCFYICRSRCIDRFCSFCRRLPQLYK